MDPVFTTIEMGNDHLEPPPLHREQQQISVPFLWEEKPGTPKQGWSSHAVPLVSSSLPFPSKLVVSVPFDWEEKPGKPLRLDLVALPATYSEDDHLNTTKINDSVWNANWQSASETDGRRRSSSSSSSTAENVAAGTSSIKLLSQQTSLDASFLNKNNGRDCARVRGDITLAKRTLTLQELMLLSRQLTCRMNQIETKKSVRPKEKLKRSVLACLPFMMGNQNGPCINSS
ncbi:uncharacterized protein LOC122037235 [Zingiber officinale]|uniref:uncharacterized protein LOC122037235 n=1 Tax=Zingiber officinale TaxID=94328 RepID=UPI001C4B71BE|nr:uncharacterized protein LOC122037235 [Zingiber officinale]